MRTNQTIEITYSKTKLFFLLLMALGIIAVGVWFLYAPPNVNSATLKDPEKVNMAAYFCIILGVFSTFKFLRNFLNNEPVLIIDDAGITNNLKGATAKYIAWADVEEAEIRSTRRQSFIVFTVKNPEEYISNQSNLLKRKAMQLDNKIFGGPLTMSVTGLKISLNKLLNIIEEKIASNANKSLV